MPPPSYISQTAETACAIAQWWSTVPPSDRATTYPAAVIAEAVGLPRNRITQALPLLQWQRISAPLKVKVPMTHARPKTVRRTLWLAPGAVWTKRYTYWLSSPIQRV